MDYMTLFPAFMRDKPRFAALAQAILSQVTDLITVIQAIPAVFSPEFAEGIQLDALGESVRIPRQSGWDDETYRKVLLRRLKLNTWNGTNETAFDYLEEGETFCDNGNGTVTVRTLSPLPAEGLIPIPIGVAAVSGS